MNYLAHLFLSRNYHNDILGNFLADMMTIDEIRQWPDSLKHGIQMHRHIDEFTDTHPRNKDMKRILRKYFRKYAGVALDLYYDYILYQNWSLYSDVSFTVFSQAQYTAILSNKAFIPDRLQYTVERMIRHNFLFKFTTLNGQSNAFAGLDHRAEFHTGFSSAMEVLQRYENDLHKSFNDFFPAMIQSVDEFQGRENPER